MNDGIVTGSRGYTEAVYQGNNQEINYYLGYLQDKKGNKAEAEKYFKAGSATAG